MQQQLSCRRYVALGAPRLTAATSVSPSLCRHRLVRLPTCHCQPEGEEEQGWPPSRAYLPSRFPALSLHERLATAAARARWGRARLTRAASEWQHRVLREAETAGFAGLRHAMVALEPECEAAATAEEDQADDRTIVASWGAPAPAPAQPPAQAPQADERTGLTALECISASVRAPSLVDLAAQRAEQAEREADSLRSEVAALRRSASAALAGRETALARAAALAERADTAARERDAARSRVAGLEAQAGEHVKAAESVEELMGRAAKQVQALVAHVHAASGSGLVGTSCLPSDAQILLARERERLQEAEAQAERRKLERDHARAAWAAAQRRIRDLGGKVDATEHRLQDLEGEIQAAELEARQQRSVVAALKGSARAAVERGEQDLSEAAERWEAAVERAVHRAAHRAERQRATLAAERDAWARQAAEALTKLDMANVQVVLGWADALPGESAARLHWQTQIGIGSLPASCSPRHRA